MEASRMINAFQDGGIERLIQDVPRLHQDLIRSLTQIQFTRRPASWEIYGAIRSTVGFDPRQPGERILSQFQDTTLVKSLFLKSLYQLSTGFQAYHTTQEEKRDTLPIVRSPAEMLQTEIELRFGSLIVLCLYQRVDLKNECTLQTKSTPDYIDIDNGGMPLTDLRSILEEISMHAIQSFPGRTFQKFASSDVLDIGYRHHLGCALAIDTAAIYYAHTNTTLLDDLSSAFYVSYQKVTATIADDMYQHYKKKKIFIIERYFAELSPFKDLLRLIDSSHKENYIDGLSCAMLNRHQNITIVAMDAYIDQIFEYITTEMYHDFRYIFSKMCSTIGLDYINLKKNASFIFLGRGLILTLLLEIYRDDELIIIFRDWFATPVSMMGDVIPSKLVDYCANDIHNGLVQHLCDISVSESLLSPLEMLDSLIIICSQFLRKKRDTIRECTDPLSSDCPQLILAMGLMICQTCYCHSTDTTCEAFIDSITNSASIYHVIDSLVEAMEKYGAIHMTYDWMKSLYRQLHILYLGYANDQEIDLYEQIPDVENSRMTDSIRGIYMWLMVLVCPLTCLRLVELGLTIQNAENMYNTPITEFGLEAPIKVLSKAIDDDPSVVEYIHVDKALADKLSEHSDTSNWHKRLPRDSPFRVIFKKKSELPKIPIRSKIDFSRNSENDICNWELVTDDNQEPHETHKNINSSIVRKDTVVAFGGFVHMDLGYVNDQLLPETPIYPWNSRMPTRKALIDKIEIAGFEIDMTALCEISKYKTSKPEPMPKNLYFQPMSCWSSAPNVDKLEICAYIVYPLLCIHGRLLEFKIKEKLGIKVVHNDEGSHRTKRHPNDIFIDVNCKRKNGMEPKFRITIPDGGKGSVVVHNIGDAVKVLEKEIYRQINLI